MKGPRVNHRWSPLNIALAVSFLAQLACLSWFWTAAHNKPLSGPPQPLPRPETRRENETGKRLPPESTGEKKPISFGNTGKNLFIPSLLQNPAAREYFAQVFFPIFEVDYQDFLNSLSLTHEQRRAVIRLLSLFTIDGDANAYTSPADSMPLRIKKFDELQSNLLGLLGKRGLDALKLYEASLPYRKELNQYDVHFAAIGEPLTASQREALVRSWEQIDMVRGSNVSFDTALYEKAGSILNERQLRELKRIGAIETNIQTAKGTRTD